METSDLVLWRRWLAVGDGEAFARLVHPELPHALGLARRTGLQAADAEDIVQDCLAELSRERTDRPIRIGLRPWLLRAAGLRARMSLRSSARRRKRERRREEPLRASSSASPDLREEVARILGELSRKDREAVLLRYLHDLDYADVARVLGTSPGAARVRVHRAITKLREKFGGGAGAVLAALPLPVPRFEAGLLSAATGSVATPLGGAIAMKIGMKTAVLFTVAGLFLGGGLAVLRASEETAGAGTAGPPAAADRELEREVARLRNEVAELEASSGGSAARPVAPSSVRTVERSSDPDRGEMRLLVLDEEGRPLPGRKLSIGGPTSLSVTTDAEGIAAATDLETARYQVVLSFDHGTRRVYAEAKTGWRTDVVLRVPALDASFTGVVRWWEGGPADRLGVFLSAQKGIYHDQFRATTGGDGRFRFEAVPGGTWTVMVSGGPIRWPWRPMSTVTLPAKGAVEREILVGVPSVRGVVRSVTTHDPVEGVRVSLHSLRGISRYAETDGDGSYSIPDLEPGSYHMGFSRDGLVGRSVSDIVVKRGEPRRIDIELETAAVVDVVLLGPDGPVTGNVHVGFRILGTGKAIASGTMSSADGRVRFTKLPPGEYEVTGGIDGVEAAPVHARLVAGQENRVILRLEGR